MKTRIRFLVVLLAAALLTALAVRQRESHSAEGWHPVADGNLLNDAGWRCIRHVESAPDLLATATGNDFVDPLNEFGHHLVVRGDFGVQVDLQVTGGPAYVALVAVPPLPHRGDQDVREVDFGLEEGQPSLAVYWGSRVRPREAHVYDVDVGSRATLELRRVGRRLVLLAGGRVVGAALDPGAFAAGRVFVGLNVGPHTRVAIRGLMATAPRGSTVALRGPLEDEGPLRVAPDSLRARAARRGLAVGAAVASELLLFDPRYRAQVAGQFDTITSENSMKFKYIHPLADRYDFCDADTLVRFARTNRMRVHGHTLVWHQEIPRWVTQREATREEAMRLLRDHIFTVVGHFKGQVAEWDVLNEPLSDDAEGGQDPIRLRNSWWMTHIGPDYLGMALRWAREADPGARLYLNEFDVEDESDKFGALLKLLQALQREGAPLDGVGLQMHTSIASAPDPEDLADVMRRIAAMGLDVRISEMDVKIEGTPSAENLADQADVFRDAVRACLQASRCSGFATWGVTDRYSWIGDFYKGWDSGSLFDAAYRPKPACTAIERELESGR